MVEDLLLHVYDGARRRQRDDPSDPVLAEALAASADVRRAIMEVAANTATLDKSVAAFQQGGEPEPPVALVRVTTRTPGTRRDA